MEELTDKYKTDKFGWCHGYTKKYEELFKHRRNDSLKILEIGIGSEPMPSLQLFKEYFPNSIIYGIDIEPDYINNTFDRIKTYCISSFDKEKINEILAKEGPFDIIIDDGVHRCDGQQITFCNFFPLLSKNGIYVIEDCGASFNFNYHMNRDFNPKDFTLISGPPDKRFKEDIPEFCLKNNNLNKTDNTINVFNNFKKNKKLISFFISNYLSKEDIKKIEGNIKNIECWIGKKQTDSLVIIYSI